LFKRYQTSYQIELKQSPQKSIIHSFGNSFFITSTKTFAQQKEQLLHNLNKLLVNTVMEDLFTPPIASRIYVYPNIAFYECIRLDDPSLPALTGKLNGLKNIACFTCQ